MYQRVLLILLVLCIVAIAIELSAKRTVPAPAPTIPLQAEKEISPLNRRIADVDFRAVPLREAFASLARQSGASIAVDWPKLSAVDIPPDAPVTLQLHDVSLQTALDRLAALFPSPRIHVLDYDNVYGGIISVSTIRYAPNSTEVFDVTDLLDPSAAKPIDNPHGFIEAPSVDLRQDVGLLARLIGEHYDPVGLTSYQPHDKLAGFGTRLISSGRPQDHHIVRTALECLRHPISLTGPDVPLHRSAFLQKQILRLQIHRATVPEALLAWQQAAGPDAPIRLSPKLASGYIIPIDLDLKNVTLGSALETILATAGYGEIGSYEEDGILHVGPLVECRVVRAYDVSDLMAHPQAWMRPTAAAETEDQRRHVSVAAQLREPSNSTPAIAANAPRGPTSDMSPDPDDEQHQSREEEQAAALIDKLQEGDPGAWDINMGEGDFRAQYFNGRLLITHSAEIHQHVLAKLRSLQQRRPTP